MKGFDDLPLAHEITLDEDGERVYEYTMPEQRLEVEAAGGRCGQQMKGQVFHWTCTRGKGHNGLHVACSRSNVCATW